MREHKYKVWHKELKQMFWLDLEWGNKHATGSGWLCVVPIGEKRTYAPDNRFDLEPVNCELLEFTGLHDKNGKEIYEGDYIRQTYSENMEIEPYTEYLSIEHKGEIMFQDGMFVIDDKEEGQYPIVSNEGFDVEVIGNIYENPELLE